MDDRIMQSLRGKTTPAEEEELRSWREASLANERHYRDVARLWALTGAAEPAAPARPPPRAADLLGSAGPGFTGSWHRRLPVRAAAIAATLLLGIGMGRLWLPLGGGSPPAATELITGAGEMVTARLADGSVVRLAPSSRLSVTGAADRREFWLDGKAFFAVEEDGRPFVVRTRAGEAAVLGTRFTVEVDAEALELVVLEGRVELSASGDRVEVGAGEVSQVVEGRSPTVERVGDVRPWMQWMEGTLVFQSTPLRAVALEIERSFGIRVVLPDSVLAERTVTALFTQAGADEVLTVVCRVVNAHCSRHGNAVTMEP